MKKRVTVSPHPRKFRTVTSGYKTYIVKSGKILQNIILRNVINNLKNTAIINNSSDFVKKI